MRSAHAFEPRNPSKPWNQTACKFCSEGPGAPIHLLALPMEIPEETLVLTSQEFDEQQHRAEEDNSQMGLFV